MEEAGACSQQSEGAEVRWEKRSLTNLRSVVQYTDTKINLKSVPKMTRPHFIMLWRTIYDIANVQPHEQVSLVIIPPIET